MVLDLTGCCVLRRLLPGGGLLGMLHSHAIPQVVMLESQPLMDFEV